MAVFDFLKRIAGGSTSPSPTASSAVGSSPPAAAHAPRSPAGPAPSAHTVESLSKTMCDRKAVHWAMESTKMSGAPTAGPDKGAMDAAEAWMKNPSAATQVAAAKAAQAAGHGGPAAWAAQAAAWAAHGGGGAAKGVPLTVPKGLPGGGAGGKMPELKLPGGGSLASVAAAGAVGLSAALKAGLKLPAPGGAGGAAPKMPSVHLPAAAPPSEADLAKMADMHKPFIELGKKIAADPSIKC